MRVPARFAILILSVVPGLLVLGPGSAGATARAQPTRSTQAQQTRAPIKRRRPKPLPFCSAKIHRHCRKRPKPVIPLTPPRATTAAAGAVSGTGATLSATVYPNGRPTSYWFQYGLSTRYGMQTAPLSLGAVKRAVIVSAALTGLNPLGVYHYRVVASHCNGCSRGTTYAADATLTVGGYQNAVYASAEAADPYVLDSGNAHDDYWAYTTGPLFGILHSPDLIHWTSMGTALTTIPSWVVPSGDWHPWAPSVVKVGESCPATASASCYVMFYVGLSAQFQHNCVATATATSPGGPFTDQGPLAGEGVDTLGRPIGCGDDLGYGMIDPSPFQDPASGQPYLYVSEDFACPPVSVSCSSANGMLEPTVSVIPLASDYMHAAGPRTPLFAGAPGTWESAGVSVPTVEGPNVTLHNGTYYLFYSGGSWHTTYGMGYATAPTPTGPFTKSTRNPILSARGNVLSPGGGDSLLTGPHGGTWMVYHGRSGSYQDLRTMRIDPFLWVPVPTAPDVPVIGGPTSNPVGAVP